MNTYSKIDFLRLTGLLVAAWLAPIPAYAAASVAVPLSQTAASSVSSSQPQGGLQALNEQELSEVAGQGIQEEMLSDWLNLNKHFTYSAATQNLVSGQFNLVKPPSAGQQSSRFNLSGDTTKFIDSPQLLLDMKTTVKDVAYDPVNAGMLVDERAGLSIVVANSIGEVNIQNIRVRGAAATSSFGSIDIKRIDLRGTTISMKSH